MYSSSIYNSASLVNFIEYELDDTTLSSNVSVDIKDDLVVTTLGAADLAIIVEGVVVKLRDTTLGSLITQNCLEMV